MQIRMTDEMKERIKEMSNKKSLTMTSLIQTYISDGLQNDEATLQFKSKENMNNLFQQLSPELLKLVGNKNE